MRKIRQNFALMDVSVICIIMYCIMFYSIFLLWSLASQQIEYKVAVLTYKVLHGSAPQYLGPLVPVADLQGRRTLRSAGVTLQSLPHEKSA